MITAISIENFKGVAERIDVKLGPITLLFGSNSAGKSTVIHALHYLREIFERKNLDPEQTLSGGEYVSFDGFQKLLHQHDSERKMKLRVDCDTSSLEWPVLRQLPEMEAGVPDPDQLISTPRSISVELELVWSQLEERPFVSAQTIHFDGILIADIRSVLGRSETMMELNLLHPCLLDLHCCEFIQEALCFDNGPPVTGLAFLLSGFRMEPDQELPPGLQESLSCWRTGCRSENAFVSEPEIHADLDSDLSLAAEVESILGDMVSNCLAMIVESPTVVIAEVLKEFRYLGPVRKTPSRNFRPVRQGELTRWASGLGAWDLMHEADGALIARVSDWLGHKEKLDAGYRIERSESIELDVLDPLMQKLLSGRNFNESDRSEVASWRHLPKKRRLYIIPKDSSLELSLGDVGIGISQVLPVIVSALAGEKRLVVIEQPELHLHPRLQAALADVFLEGVKQQGNQFIIETHSEHLVLRLLRRIRETAKGVAPEGFELRTNDVFVYFFRQSHGVTAMDKIDIDIEGRFIQPWPDDFFEVDFHERFS